nr:MAG TPA: hypothetical protein [Caudoviricetes sp.]
MRLGCPLSKPPPSPGDILVPRRPPITVYDHCRL